MKITDVLALLSGVAFFLFGMSLMGDGLKKVAGNKLELILYKLTNTPLKGLLLGMAVTAIIQSSSATTVMVVGFVNSGMMQVSQSIGIIMGANIGTSITGWILCLSYLEGSNGIAQLLSTATITAVVAIAGILLKTLAKRVSYRNVGDIMLGFSILMFGMQRMSDAVSPLKESPQFTNALTMFSNPFIGIIIGILFTAVLQSASASVGILQALSMTGSISFATALPIIMGIGVGAACPVLLSSIGTNNNGRRTALIYLLNDLFGMVFWSITFYTANAIFHFPIMDVVMNPVLIAIMNSVFRIATICMLLPFIRYIEKLVFLLVKDSPEDEEDRPNFDILEERFLKYPAIAISQSHAALNSMAIQARKNIARAIDLLEEYSPDRYKKIQEKEVLIDKYEDKLGTYLLQVTGKELTEDQTKEVSKFLHTISDFERLGDYAVNISKVANELMEKKKVFSEEAQQELRVLNAAVIKVVDITVDSFCKDDLYEVAQVEPLRELIGILCAEVKIRHVERVKKGICDMKQGFAFNDLLNALERIADHCSNVAAAMIELKNSSFDTHEYLKYVRKTRSTEYMAYFREFEQTYSISV